MSAHNPRKPKNQICGGYELIRPSQFLKFFLDVAAVFAGFADLRKKKLMIRTALRKPAAVSNGMRVPAVPSKGAKGIEKRTKNMIVLKRSFSQNNPGNSIKV